MYSKIMWYDFVFVLYLLFFSYSSNAWNRTGHFVISHIAYQQLKPEVLAKVDKLSQVFDVDEVRMSFEMGSVWADALKSHDVHEFDDLHFIDIPYVTDGAASKAPEPKNAVWAIAYFHARLNDADLDNFERAIALRFLVHFIEDIHQPMHAVSLYSRAFPEGDKGGNLYLIDTPDYKNLHQLWDAGLGLFPGDAAVDEAELRTIAEQLQKEFPIESFTPEQLAASSLEWAQESTALGIKAYQTPYDSKVGSEYAKLGQYVVRQRVALAGYRLATILNQCFQ